MDIILYIYIYIHIYIYIYIYIYIEREREKREKVFEETITKKNIIISFLYLISHERMALGSYFALLSSSITKRATSKRLPQKLRVCGY